MRKETPWNLQHRNCCSTGMLGMHCEPVLRICLWLHVGLYEVTNSYRHTTASSLKKILDIVCTELVKCSFLWHAKVHHSLYKSLQFYRVGTSCVQSASSLRFSNSNTRPFTSIPSKCSLTLNFPYQNFICISHIPYSFTPHVFCFNSPHNIKWSVILTKLIIT